MAIIQCPECGKNVSDQAAACPGCGYPISREQKPIQYQVPNQTGVRCPKCGSTNIIWQAIQQGTVGVGTNRVVIQEQKKSKGCLYWLFIGWWWELMILPFKAVFGALFGGRKKSGLNYNASKTINQTKAICQNCGNTWIPIRPKEQEPKEQEPKEKKPIDHKTVIIVAAVVFAIVVVGLMGSGKGYKVKNETITTVQETQVVESDTSDYDNVDEVQEKQENGLDAFDYDINGGNVLLRRYTGNSDKVIIHSNYEVDGTEYITDLSDFQIGNSKVNTIIFDEGITDIKVSIFNSSDVETIYFPQSITMVYDYTLSYLHPDNGKIQIYYAGTKDEWDSIFTEYQRTSVEDAETAEGKGRAVADWLNEKIGVSYDDSLFEYHFNASQSDVE